MGSVTGNPMAAQNPDWILAFRVWACHSPHRQHTPAKGTCIQLHKRRRAAPCTLGCHSSQGICTISKRRTEALWPTLFSETKHPCDSLHLAAATGKRCRRTSPVHVQRFGWGEEVGAHAQQRQPKATMPEPLVKDELQQAISI